LFLTDTLLDGLCECFLSDDVGLGLGGRRNQKGGQDHR
jgi:hypothetical protein